MDLLIGTVLFTVLSFGLCGAPAGSRTSDLTVSNGGPWGVWGRIQFCRKGHAYGFSIKILPVRPSGDASGLEGVRLHCTDGSTAESSSSPWGDWSDVQTCPKGNLTSFSLKVAEYQGVGDDTAANNIKFRCSDGNVLTGVGHKWGEFGAWSSPCYLGFICGLQTMVEPPQGSGDDTGLNDVKFFCCL